MTDADPSVGANTHVLEHAVVDQRERLTVLDAGEEDQPAIGSWLDTIPFLHTRAVVLALVHDVRLHTDREISACGPTLHRAPLVDYARLIGRNLDIDPRAADGIASGQKIRVGPLQHLDRVRHRQHARDIGVVDDQH